jgi:alpha-beta hydrolase superfamily lysophospholipase
MKHEEMQWITNDAIKLYAQRWEPESNIRGAICLVHGLGEHSSRYRHWADKLTAAGYAVLAYDLRGHGKSGGKRGHAASFDHHADDICTLVEHAGAFYSEKPLFVYGHSLGGLLALFFLIQRQPDLNGAIVTSPGLETMANRQKAKVTAARILGSIAPRVSIANGLELDGLSRDPAVIKAYLNDPLVHNQITLGMGRDMFAAAEYVYEKASSIELPLLLMHGSEDRITYLSGTEKIAKTVSGECVFKVWDGFYHELHNEPEQNDVFDYLREWLNKHSGEQ